MPYTSCGRTLKTLKTNELYILDWNDNLAVIFRTKLMFKWQFISVVFLGAIDTILPEMHRDLMSHFDLVYEFKTWFSVKSFRKKSRKMVIELFTRFIIINLFINSDAILNRDALWSIQGKKHYFYYFYSEHLSVIYNNKNYGSLPYILFIAVQNSSISLDRPQCIAICSKFKMASLLLKNSIVERQFSPSWLHQNMGLSPGVNSIYRVHW